MAELQDTEAPTRELDSDELLVRLRAWFQDDFDHFVKWRDEAKEDFEFVAGRQWEEEALKTLQEQGRPASVYNIIAPMIDSVCGFEVSNRQEVRFIPRKLGVSGVNEMLTSVGMWFRDQTDGEDEDSDAFRDASICGMGWTETRIDYETNPDGDPRMSRVDPLEIFTNRGVVKPNIDDARRIWRIRSLALDEAQGLFPDEEPGDLNCGWGDEDSDGEPTHVYPGRDYDGDGEDDTGRKEVTIVECQWYEREPFVRFIDGATGEEQELSEERFNTLIDRLAALAPEQMMLMGIVPPENIVRQQRRVYRRCFIGRKILGDVMPTPIDGHFTYEAVTGKRDRNKGNFYGLVRAMKDPQRWTNKLFSQIIHILNSNAKGGILAERGAFEDDRKASEDFARADSIVWTQAGAIRDGRISPKPQAPFPAGQAQMMEFAMSSMPRVTGINLEFLGMRDTNQPGVLEYQRRQAGVTILATLFDSLRRYRKRQGRLMLRLIQEYLSDDRLVKIIDQDMTQYLPLNRSLTLGEYDVIVDDAPSAPNAKDRNWEVIQSMLPLIQPFINQKIASNLFRYSPLPESIVAALIESLNQPPPQPPPPDPYAEKMKEVILAGAVAEADKAAATAEKNRADAIKTQVEAINDGLEAFQNFVSPDLPPAPIPSVPMAGFMPGMATPHPMQPVAPMQGIQPIGPAQM